jgi:hypothetical protein
MTRAHEFCIRGHRKTNDNIYIRKDGSRECRECLRAKDKARYPSRRKEVIARAIKWGKDNPEKFKANQAQQELRPEVKARRAKFYQENKNTFWRRYAGLKGAAKFYKRDFEITLEDYTRFVRNNACFYCSGPLPVAGYGIDRLNNLIGYVFANCVPCCETCNEKKGRLEGLGFQYPRTIQLMMELLGNN